MIRRRTPEDTAACVPALMSAYNGPPWENHWSEATALGYLGELAAAPRALGWVDERDGRIAGALFAHERTWWTRDEIFVDELFVHRDFQGQGIGRALLRSAEAHCAENGLAGVTLLTDRNMPAMGFYRSGGYTSAGHVVFLYKNVLPND